MQQIGRKTQVYIGKETTFGVKASSFTALPVTEFDFNPQQNFADDNSAIGRIEEMSDSDVSQKWSEPSFTGLILDEAIGDILLAGFGVVATSADTPEAGVNTHDFSVKNDNSPISYTLIFKDDTQTKMITGATINSLQISAEDLADYTKFTASFVGNFPEDTTETVAFVEENTFAPKFANVKLAADLAGLDAASPVDVESFSLTIEKNAEANYKLGSVQPALILNKSLTISGEATVVYASDFYFDNFQNISKNALRFQLINTDVTIGAASNPTLQINLARVSTRDYAREAGVDDKILETFSLFAEFSKADSEIGSSKLINTKASY